ncbi:MAG: hypothetical protein CSB33_04655 [Desulfobacterales bacterium]|nr:MAG: hypothetical protein CSB33_04655 [Desulfobacterales bacterium]
MDFLMCVIGLVMFIEGFPYAAFPSGMKQMLALMRDQPPGTLRGFGLILMLGGLLMIWLARSGG